MPGILHVETARIEKILLESRTHERKRALDLVRSSGAGDVPAIMYNALQRGTYIQPHRHPEQDGKEMWVLHQGEVGAVLYSEYGRVEEAFRLSRDTKTLLEIPAGMHHTALALEKDTVLLELYFGVYKPETYKEFAPWAPAEKEKDLAKDYLTTLYFMFGSVLG